MASLVEEPVSLPEYNNSNTLVQKYGGTSVGTAKAMLNVANIIKKNNKVYKGCSCPFSYE